MINFCGDSPFYKLGFIQTDENMWVKYADGDISVPHFILSTTINPVSQTFIVKDLIYNEIMSSNHFETIKQFILSSQRQDKIKKILK